MLSVKQFYAEPAWGLPFGAFGSDYTIVEGRHIGFDVARTGDVPALLAGVIVRVVKTGTMAWGVVTDIGDGLYLSYWHLADDDLPREGTRLAQGDRVGRIARGPRTLPVWNSEFPGTSWLGQHTHIVVGTNPGSAYLKIAGHRTLSAFRDPLDFIRRVLAGQAGLGEKPFIPTTPAVGDEDMRAVKLAGVPNSGIIIQAATPPYSMDEQVFTALCGAYGLTAQDLADWQYGTVVREQWAAFNAANPTVDAQPVDIDLSEADKDALAKKISQQVREGLQLTFTVHAS